MNRLELRDVSIYDGSRTAILSAISFDVAPGEILGLLGPNGSGKTSLLMAVLGFIPPMEEKAKSRWTTVAWGTERRRMSGKIFLDGEDVTTWAPGRRGISFVPQNLALYPDKSVLQNLAFPLLVQGLPRREALCQAEALAKRLDLDGVMHRRPGEISGGQQQRVAIGRAVVHRPRLICFDEPTASLDALSKRDVLDHVYAVLRERRASGLFVTHDPIEAALLCDRVAFIDNGRMHQVAAPECAFEKPASLFVARLFSGFSNAIAGGVVDGLFIPAQGSGSWNLGQPGITRAGICLAGRPDAFIIADNGTPGVAGVLLGRYTIEGVSYARVEIAPGVVLACRHSRRAEAGSRVQVALESNPEPHVRLFDEKGALQQ